ncbi:MAG: RIP metalloprotease RseP [Candidatus Levybacteria bacterium]|nr:RIP metalloprotease RseP [Candidatus Levybacteria bacterium]
MFITIIAFIVVLSILVLIHELGHFLTAKKFGIKVEEFGFGFPPRVFGKRIGETLYSINLLPIGGFVKLYGEDQAGGGSIRRTKSHPFDKLRASKLTANSQQLKRAFFARPAWQRATIVLAGVIMNFLLAVVLISYLFSAHGVAIPTENIRVVEIAQNSPAAAAGIQKGDEIITIDGKRITQTPDFAKIAKAKAGQPIKLELLRKGKEFLVSITPRKEVPEGQGPIGVAISNIEVKKYPWYSAPFFGTLEAFKFSFMILQGLSEMVINLVLYGKSPTGIAGPVGVAQLTGQAVSYGIVATLWFVSLLSLNLAVVNVLPIPALDGGRLFFILIELVTGKKISPRHEAMAHAIGLAVLLALILFITFFDIARVLSGQTLLPKM